jgi:hypothetical protein
MIDVAPFPMTAKFKKDAVTWPALGVVIAIILPAIGLAGLFFHSSFQKDIASVEKSIGSLEKNIGSMDKNIDGRLKSMESSISAIQQRLYLPIAKAKGIKDPRIIVTKAQPKETFSAAYGSEVLHQRLEVTYRISKITAETVQISSELAVYHAGKLFAKGPGPTVKITGQGDAYFEHQALLYNEAGETRTVRVPPIVISILERRPDQLVIATGETAKSGGSKKS